MTCVDVYVHVCVCACACVHVCVGILKGSFKYYENIIGASK